jgi:hypothetical protein
MINRKYLHIYTMTEKVEILFFLKIIMQRIIFILIREFLIH